MIIDGGRREVGGGGADDDGGIGEWDFGERYQDDY